MHSVSVKAYVKNKYGVEKPQKRDVFDCMLDEFPNWDPVDQFDYDVSDSIAVAATLLGKKWNQDIDDKIKEIKKEIKTLKMESRINVLKEEIERLLEMKI